MKKKKKMKDIFKEVSCIKSIIFYYFLSIISLLRKS